MLLPGSFDTLNEENENMWMDGIWVNEYNLIIKGKKKWKDGLSKGESSEF